MLNPIVFDLIVCPECGGTEFDTVDLPDRDGFTDCGAIICRNDAAMYLVESGILRLLRPVLADVERELAFIDAYRDLLPGEPVARREEQLRSQADADDREWIMHEKEFWDERKYRPDQQNGVQPYNWNRFEQRRRHITDYIQDGIRGKVVMEFGGGNSATLYHIMNPETFGYTLVCSDISFNGLLAAKHHHPTAICIQCDAIEPPIRDESVDVLIELGCLHHLPNNDRVLERHVELLKPGGYLGLHDPINRRGPFFTSVPGLKSLAAEESDHNECIDETHTMEFLSRAGTIVHAHVEGTPVRTWMVKALVDKMKIDNRAQHTLTIGVDEVVKKTVGRMWKRMDANSLLLLWRKDEPNGANKNGSGTD